MADKSLDVLIRRRSLKVGGPGDVSLKVGGPGDVSLKVGGPVNKKLNPLCPIWVNTLNTLTVDYTKLTLDLIFVIMYD